MSLARLAGVALVTPLVVWTASAAQAADAHALDPQTRVAIVSPGEKPTVHDNRGRVWMSQSPRPSGARYRGIPKSRSWTGEAL